jgi:PIN domain nuclease of toxin-antitoxin system
MKYLLDTHYLLWSIVGSKKISSNILDIISDSDQEVFVSTISLWEISLKSIFERIGFDMIELSAADSISYHQLKASHHKDPFDRMLIWQAIRNNYTLITADKQIGRYRSEGLKILNAENRQILK